ncbi:MAG TPA: PQQ-binding-like beta-propeller repeat protein [Pyrinomonadaceae bacterium]|nr:PQQ-binding-like beta-propeller repeat protein [Pyrinomonadaceae bacterium]
MKSIVFLLTLFLPSIFAAEPSVWTVGTRADVLKGDSRGVSIDANGAITLAPKLTEIYKTEQPYIWSSVVDSGGNVFLGTGSDGRIYRVSAAGAGVMFADLNELNVTALAVAQGGALFAATSPDGKVYRVDPSGKADIYFEPKEKYIWSLAVMGDGSLAVGTGEGGKIYRVRSANAAPEASLLFDTSETHIISLAVDKQGNLYAGTDSNGLVMRFGADGKPFGLLDSPLREIHEITIGPDGSAYVLALGESASVATPTTAVVPTATPETKTVSADRPNPMAPPTPDKSRYDLTGAKSAVYRILPDGGSDVMWASTTITGFSIYAHQTGSGVLLGTSDKGRVYNITNAGRETLVLQSDTNQISTIRSLGTSLYATSSNQGRLFRIGPDTVGEGNYESAVFDAKAAATWGRIWWQSSGNVLIQTRSGNTEKADETWSGWAPVAAAARSAQIPSPKARYMQWRAVLRSGANTILNEVSVSFLPRNIAPEVLSIAILPTNVGLIPNPPIQIDPNIELTGLDPAVFGVPNASVPPRRAYLRGARSFQWTAEDRNGDKLVYDVFYKEAGESSYKPLRRNLTENFLSLDGQTLADGRYVLQVVAKDIPENPANQSLSGERVSEPFDIDNTQPAITASGTPQNTATGARVTFLASDKSSYLTSAEYSINGGEWVTVYADDGISDGPDERYTIDVPLSSPGEYAVTLRVFDSQGNAGNARVIVRK